MCDESCAAEEVPTTTHGVPLPEEMNGSTWNTAKVALMRRMLQVTKDKLWDRIAEINNRDCCETISLAEDPIPVHNANVNIQ